MAGVDIEQVVLSHLRDVPDFPKPGILFKDITPLLKDADAFAAVVEDIAGRYTGRVDAVAGIEARGFILGAAVAYRLGVGFVPVRKSGKLPGPFLAEEYTLEYGTATLEVRDDAFRAGERVLIVDDVLATGGTLTATARLVERTGAEIVGVEMVLELSFLHGRDRADGLPLHILATV